MSGLRPPPSPSSTGSSTLSNESVSSPRKQVQTSVCTCFLLRRLSTTQELLACGHELCLEVPSVPLGLNERASRARFLISRSLHDYCVSSVPPEPAVLVTAPLTLRYCSVSSSTSYSAVLATAPQAHVSSVPSEPADMLATMLSFATAHLSASALGSKEPSSLSALRSLKPTRVLGYCVPCVARQLRSLPLVAKDRSRQHSSCPRFLRNLRASSRFCSLSHGSLRAMLTRTQPFATARLVSSVTA